MKNYLRKIMEKTAIFFSKHFFLSLLISIGSLFVSIPTGIVMFFWGFEIRTLILSRRGHNPIYPNEITWVMISKKHEYWEDADEEYKQVMLKRACVLFWIGILMTILMWLIIVILLLVAS